MPGMATPRPSVRQISSAHTIDDVDYDRAPSVSDTAGVVAEIVALRQHGISIRNINMPFWSMVGLMIKAAFAAIPAMIILSFMFAVITAVFGGAIAALMLGSR